MTSQGLGMTETTYPLPPSYSWHAYQLTEGTVRPDGPCSVLLLPESPAMYIAIVFPDGDWLPLWGFHSDVDQQSVRYGEQLAKDYLATV